MLERYQRHLFFYRKKNGEPLTFRSQHARLVPLRVWFRWMTRQNHILHNPASEIELPRLGRSLPKNILSVQEVEQVMTLRDIEEPIGLRDRAILEVLYSTGLRRLEIIHLKLFDLSLDRGLVLVRQGKGKKDRYVPIGERAMAWLRKYIAEARPQLAIEPDDFTVFLTAEGEPFSRDHLTWTVRERIDAAKTGQGGSLPSVPPQHGDADARERSRHPLHPGRSSATRTSRPRRSIPRSRIRALQQVYAATHPAALLERRRKPALAQSRRCQTPKHCSRRSKQEAEEDREEPDE